MTTISYATARNHLAKILEKVCEDHQPIIIKRSNAKSVVLISLEDYSAIKETHYLLKSQANAVRLSAATNEIEAVIAKRKKA